MKGYYRNPHVGQPNQRWNFNDKTKNKERSANSVWGYKNKRKQEISFEMISGDIFSLRFKHYVNKKLLTFLKTFSKDGGSKWFPE